MRDYGTLHGQPGRVLKAFLALQGLELTDADMVEFLDRIQFLAGTIRMTEGLDAANREATPFELAFVEFNLYLHRGGYV